MTSTVLPTVGFLVGERSGANAVHPNFRKLLAHLPTLSHALLETCRAVTAETSRIEMTVYSPELGITRFCHKASFGIEHPIHHQIEWFAIMAMIGIIREFTGPVWHPKEIGLMPYRTPSRTAK